MAEKQYVNLAYCFFMVYHHYYALISKKEYVFRVKNGIKILSKRKSY